MNHKTKFLCLSGLFIALVAICTGSLYIPVPATNGYIHLGDSVILIVGVFFGWKYGILAGGVGSMLADILTGYAYWAPFTLIIKGFMGFAAGKLGDTNAHFLTPRNMFAAFITEIIMVTGYFLGGAILKSSFIVALGSVPANILQGVGGILIFAVVGLALQKAKIKQYLM